MRKLYSSLWLLGGVISLFGQDVLWQKDLKSSTQDFLSGLSTTVDRQFVVSGSSIQPPKLTGVSSDGATKQNNGYDYHLVKLDQQGEEVWEKYFAGNNHDFLVSTASTQEGGFLLAGTSFSMKGQDKKDDAKGGSDIWLIKLSENGEEQWQKTLGTKSNEEARAVIQALDLGYFVAGTREDRQKGFGSKDVWIIKTDQNGNPTKELLLGGKGLDQVEKMIPTLDGGVLIGVYSRSSAFATENLKDKAEKLTYIAKESDNEGQGDFWVIKLDKEANIEWQRNFGGAEDDHIRTMVLTSTGYVIGGESRSKKSGNKSAGVKEGTDIWLISLNQRGEKEWEKSYTFGNRDLMMSLSHITGSKSTETRGFLLGGYTQAEGKIEKDDETFWMLYIDGNGEEIWRKHIEGKSRQKQERLVTAQLLGDGTFILAGTSAKELGKENWKIVRLADDQLDDLIVKHDIKIYPNPADDYCYVEIGFKIEDEQRFEATIDLYDMSGRHIKSYPTKNKVTKIQMQGLPQGVYLVSVKTNINQTANAKVIKK